MKRSVAALAIGTLLLLTSGSKLRGTPPSEFRDLFNGKDLTGWLCKSRGEWNTYQVVAVDDVIKLSVNREFVNGISRSTKTKGSPCLESESAEIHFRKIKIMEPPHGVTSLEQSATELD